MVNRISQFLESSAPPRFVEAEEIARPRSPAGKTWLAFLELQVRRRPRLWLGMAFVLGAGVAWLTKRK